MIGQIGYLGQVSSRVGIVTALLYTAGATIGAALVGLALGAVGAGARWALGLSWGPPGPGLLLLVAGLALVGGLRDLGFLRFRLPQPPKQVPRGWLEVFGPHRTGFLWGLAVGLAYTTMIQYSLYYVLAFWILLMGSPLVGAAALAIYGFAQGALLTADVLAIAVDGRWEAGLLGRGRTGFFFLLSGAALLALAVLLAGQSVAVQLAGSYNTS